MPDRRALTSEGQISKYTDVPARVGLLSLMQPRRARAFAPEVRLARLIVHERISALVQHLKSHVDEVDREPVDLRRFWSHPAQLKNQLRDPAELVSYLACHCLLLLCHIALQPQATPIRSSARRVRRERR
jgi:hypothetical protein